MKTPPTTWQAKQARRYILIAFAVLMPFVAHIVAWSAQ